MSRLNELILIVGVRGTGKTTIAKMVGEKAGKRSIIVDTDDHPSYSDLPLYSLSKAMVNTSSSFRMIESDIDEVLSVLNRNQTNAVVTLEDATKVLGSTLSKAQKTFFVDMRKRNFDVIVMFHSLADIAPWLCRNYNRLILFRTDDNLNVNLQKFNNWETIKTIAARVNKQSAKNFNYCEAINKR